MRVGLIGSDRIYEKIQKPLECVKIDCVIIRNLKDAFVHRQRYDMIIVDIAGFKYLFLASVYKIIHKSYVVYRARGDFTKELNKLKRFILSLIIKNICDAIIFVSHFLKKRFFEERIVVKRMEVVEIPKDVEKYASKSELIHHDSNFVVTLTNFDYFDKIKILVEYLKPVDTFLSEIGGKWYIAGKGKYVEYFKKKLKNVKNTEYIGFVNPTNILSKAKILIHLSKLEGLPNAVLEGMAAELPVIVNDYEPLKKIDHVIVVKNEKELIQWLRKLYENPALRKKLGVKGQKYVKRKYNPKIVGMKYKKILKELPKCETND